MKMKKKVMISSIAVVITFALLALQWVVVMRPLQKGALPDGYRIENVKKHLEVIAAEPHSDLYHKEAKNRVREYIKKELEELGVTVKEFAYKDVPTHKEVSVDLENLYGVMESTKESRDYLMLVCHYDSASSNPQEKEGYSNGMADDGYGVATVLETIRYIKEECVERNMGLKVLVTDGEELRLLGSKEAVEKNPEIFDNVISVINIEARGTSGPVIIGGISGNEENLLNWLQQSKAASANSFIIAANGTSARTDFQNICKLEIPGIDIMAIGNVENYHTTKDSLSNLSEASLEHYGAIVANLTFDAMTNDNTSIQNASGKEGRVFFTLFPNVIVSCTMGLANIIAIVSILFAVVVMILFYKRNIDRKRIFAKCIGRQVAITGITLIAFTALAFLLCLITGTTFVLAHMGTFMGDHMLMCIVPVCMVIFVMCRGYKEDVDHQYEMLAFLFLQTLLALLCLLFFSRASYLFLSLPLFAVALLIKNRMARKIVWGIGMMVCVITWFQLILILYMAFSIAMLGLCTCLVGILTYGYRALLS